MHFLTRSSLFSLLRPRAVVSGLAMTATAFLGTACVADFGGEVDLAPEQGVFAALASDGPQSDTATDTASTELTPVGNDFTLAACGDGVQSPGELCFLSAALAGGITNYLDAIEAGQLNAGRNLDFVGSQSSADLIRIGAGNGAGGFSSTWTWAVGDGPGDVDYGDFNNDGFVDIIATNFHSDTMRIRWGASVSPWSTSHSYPIGDGPYRVRVADLNGDGRDDFVTVNALADTISVALRQAGGGFAFSTYATGDFVYDVKLADVDNDGDIDMLYPQDKDTATKLVVRRNNGSGAFAAPISTNLGLTFGESAHALTVGDWNEDGRADVVVTINTHKMVRLLGNGNGTFGGLASAATQNNPIRIINADMDKDGHRDLVIAHFTAQKISIFRGHGNGNFSPAFVISPGKTVNDLDAGDFDGDGTPDIVFGASDGAYLIRSNP